MIKEVTTLEELELLAKDSAPCWEGLCMDGLEKDFQDLDPEAIPVYCTGKTYNQAYGLTGSNAYPDDLHIVFLINWSIPMMDWKFKYGCRWADDMRDNNLEREK